MSESMAIEVDGQKFSVDDFEGRELVDAERAFGISLFGELERGSVTGVYALLFIIKRRQNPAFSVDDALALNLGQVQQMIGDQGGQAGPPTRRRAPKVKVAAA